MPTQSTTTQVRHVRYFEPGVAYHFVSRTLRGEFLLAPRKGVAELSAGVVAKALENSPGVKLYAYAFMSNHIHLMASGPAKELSDFVGDIKQELSRRLGERDDIKGTYWDGEFSCSALPTEESQEACLRYILSQGVKEDLVERPEHWRGLHCAKQLVSGQPDKGEWFLGTEYGKAKRAQERRVKKKNLRVGDYFREMTLVLHPLMCWEEHSPKKRQQLAREMVEDIVATEAARRKKEGKRVLGRKAVAAMPITGSSKPKRPPWWENRRRQVVAWAKRFHEKTLEYLANYWAFQRAYREGVDRYEAEAAKTSWLPQSACAPPVYVS